MLTMRRGGHVRILQERENAVDPSALHLESGRTVGTHVKIVALAAFSIAISILTWRLQPGHNLESRKNPGIVFPLYQKFANGSHVGGAGRGSRGGLGRRIRSDDELNPTFELRLPHRLDGDTEFYIEIIVGSPPKPFYFHIDTGSGSPWVHCAIPGYYSPLAHFGPNGPFVSNEKSIVKCTGPSASLCYALQYNVPCRQEDDYKCIFSALYADGSSYRGLVVNESLTVPIQDGTERSVFALFGCVLDKRSKAEILPLQTDGLAGLGKCKGSLVDQLQAGDRKVLGVCVGKDICRAGQVGYISMGMDFEEKFDQSKAVWVKLVPGHKRECVYAAKLLFVSIGAIRIAVGSLDLANAGMELGFDTGADWTYLRQDVYDEVLDAGPRPIDKFPPLKFEFEGIPATELPYLIFQPEKYLSWDEDKSKLCVNILVNKAQKVWPILGVQMMRENLFVFDITNHRVRWTPSNDCIL